MNAENRTMWPTAESWDTYLAKEVPVTCTDCGCVAIMTRHWLADVGAPTCGCGGSMAVGGAS